jgi:L-ornithine Nalpha-acyltransferase
MTVAQDHSKARQNAPAPIFEVQFARSRSDLVAAQRLRYDVFVKELGADGPLVDHKAGREIDEFDDFADHLLLRDLARPADDAVVGVYRLLSQKGARAAGRFYCAAEFDLTLLVQSRFNLLELGRSCLHRDYRGGMAMMHLWQALARHVQQEKIEILFGVASFHGTDLAALAAPLSLLHHRHLAPPALRVQACGAGARGFAPLPEHQIDRLAAMRDTPALIKAYLRLGGVVGEGVFVDHAFNTTDVCLILPTAGVNAMQRQIFDRAARNV